MLGCKQPRSQTTMPIYAGTSSSSPEMIHKSAKSCDAGAGTSWSEQQEAITQRWRHRAYSTPCFRSDLLYFVVLEPNPWLLMLGGQITPHHAIHPPQKHVRQVNTPHPHTFSGFDLPYRLPLKSPGLAGLVLVHLSVWQIIDGLSWFNYLISRTIPLQCRLDTVVIDKK